MTHPAPPSNRSTLDISTTGISTPNTMPGTVKAPGFRVFAWFFVVYLIAVALFGAWVRITHSGAGCGDHWPSCHGEVIPLAPSIETVIEFTHRASTGVLGILSLILLAWAWRRFGFRHRVTLAAVVTNIFIIFESLIGAKLVLSELVTDNDSVARAVVVAIHLGNTLALTGAAALCAWWATSPRPARGSAKSLADSTPAPNRQLRWLFGVGVLAIILTSMMGAITALGDTLFPVDPTLGHGLFDRVRSDLSTANHFLVRLRIIHPIVAVVASIFLIALTTMVRTARHTSLTAKKAALFLLICVVTQLFIGSLNIWLAAPGWMQIVHLTIAQALWIGLLITAEETLRPTTS